MAFGRKKNDNPGSTEAVSGEDVPFWQQPKWIIPAGFLAVVIILGLVLTLVNAPQDGAAVPETAGGGAQVTPSTAPTASSPPRDSGGGSVCGLPAGDQSIPSSPPQGTKWVYLASKLDQTVQIALPTSPAVSPGTVAAGGYQRSCFARSPTGALFAAANYVLALSLGEHRWAFEHRAAPGPGRDALLRMSSAEITSMAKPAQLAGFAVEVYTGERAVVDISVVAGQYGSTSQITLVWASGDWEVMLPSSGMLPRPADLALQLIPWRGAAG